jgi:hypothetical protein
VRQRISLRFDRSQTRRSAKIQGARVHFCTGK